MEVSEKLKKLRDSKGFTQSQLAEIAGVSYKTISSWESGTRSPKMGGLLRICNYFGYDIYKFIDEDSDDLSDAFLSGQKESPTPGGAELTPTQQKAWEFIQQMDDEALERFIAAAKALMG